MTKRMLSMGFIWLVFCVISVYAAATVTLDPKPQAYSNTCQSYSIAYALSSVDSTYTIDSAAQLRALELKIRDDIVKNAAALGLSSSHHEVWKKTIASVTDGALKLKVQYFTDAVALFKKASEITNSWDAEQSLAASYFGIARPVMTSVTRVEQTKYTSGHIVTILGLDIAPRSPKNMAVLNSAIKHGATTKFTCLPGDLEGDFRYSAQAAVISDYDLKTFNGKYLLMWIAK